MVIGALLSGTMNVEDHNLHIRVRYVLEEYNGSWVSFSHCSSQTIYKCYLNFYWYKI